MNILITGARAPICADLVKCLAGAGHAVHVCDSFRWPVGRFSPHVKRYHRLPAPARDFNAFRAQMLSLVGACAIDHIIPTSEEVFWLAQVPELEPVLLAPSIEQLDRLHHKGEFASIAARLGYGAPNAIELKSLEDAEEFLAKHDPEKFVLKPCYSRFGTQVLMSPTRADMLSLAYDQPWLAQTRVTGREVCLYSVAASGRRCLHVAYEPVYRAGPGASIYFRPVSDPRLDTFVSDVLADQKLTGQVSFDVMLTHTGVVALECNPRGVSGIHLASQHPYALSKALLNGQSTDLHTLEPCMLGLALMLYQPLQLLTREGRQAFYEASDALKRADVPWYGSLLATTELLTLAALKGRSPLTESTLDIEWNGRR